MTFIMVFAGPIGLKEIGWKFWLVILSGNVFAIGFVFFLCPETGGKSLEQVDFLFTRSALAFKTVSIEDLEGSANDKFDTLHDEIVVGKSE